MPIISVCGQEMENHNKCIYIYMRLLYLFFKIPLYKNMEDKNNAYPCQNTIHIGRGCIAAELIPVETVSVIVRRALISECCIQI